MLLAVVHLGYQHIVGRFGKDVPFPNAFHLHVHRHARRDFGDMVVQERHPSLDGVRHLHPIGEIVQNEIRQHRFAFM